MPEVQLSTLDGNEAVASVAYRINEVIAIYPITPASPMGEWCDGWSARQQPNVWGDVPQVVEMQSEAGAAGAVHGALQAGSLTTTFTASQGLLLMIPNLYKIAGELNAFCLHVAARTLATHALSIFGDHSDVMACRQTGMAMLCSCSVQEAHDFACIGQAASLRSRIALMHFFDGFRTSHEVSKIAMLSDDDLLAMLCDESIAAHRSRSLTPDRPVLRGTAQNPDTFFQAREACNPFHDACADIVLEEMDRFAQRTGRRYRLFDYVGHPEADRVVVMMGSGAETAHETVEHLVHSGERVGLVKVRLYRPFDIEAFVASLPASVRHIAVLDRTKEPGAVAEPLHLDILAALREAGELGIARFTEQPRVIGGRYGLSSKEFTPAMVRRVFDELHADQPKNYFTIGIVDDVTHRSLEVPVDAGADVRDGGGEVVQALFYGLGSDGTVGANKNTIKIIGESTDLFAQGYFVYDSKKAGARTVSHLRFGPEPIRSSYLVQRANFVACSQFVFLDRYDMLEFAGHGATFLLNSHFAADAVWDTLPRQVQQQIIEKQLRFFVIDANKVAADAGMGRHTNTVLQACFFALSDVLDTDEAIDKIKGSIRKTYARKGDEVVRRNIDAVDHALAHLHEVAVPDRATATRDRAPIVSENAPEFVQRVSAVMLADKGDLLPVSAFPPDGTWPLSSTRWEKRNIAIEIPIWEPDVCIQCNQCVFVCPHTAIRAKVFDGEALSDAPSDYQSVAYKAPEFRGLNYTIQVAPEDCTGCNLCVVVCPAKDRADPKRKAINMRPHQEHVDRERENYDFFLDIPDIEPSDLRRIDAKSSQFMLPMFEYSGACAGCGETPYVKLMTQLFGDRLLISNATGCSSIYGGNLPTTPYCTNDAGRGPAWSNSLFEDNAEFGFGFRLSVDQQSARARQLLSRFAGKIDASLGRELLESTASEYADIAAQRERVSRLREQLKAVDDPEARELMQLADYLVDKSVWLVGGDGWAYDIGYGGLDHVLASDRNVNILVLDTEVYSNTGGQQSKATPLGAAAKFAAAGKETFKKDLGLMAMSYGHAYVASVAFGANMNQTVMAMREAEAFPGPSLIIAYSHCIAHGYDMRFGTEQQKRAVQCGIWPLYRFDPRNILKGEPPLHLDGPAPKGSVTQYMANEARFRIVEKIDPQRFRRLAKAMQRHTTRRIELYRQLAALHMDVKPSNGATGSK